MPKQFSEGEELYYVGLGYVTKCKVNKRCEGKRNVWLVTFGGLSTAVEVVEEHLHKTRADVVVALDKYINELKQLRNEYAV